VSVAGLGLAYWPHARSCHRKHGRPTGSIDRIRAAIQTLGTTYGTTLAKDFSPLALQVIQCELAAGAHDVE
jgi:hypothetical protein